MCPAGVRSTTRSARQPLPGSRFSQRAKGDKAVDAVMAYCRKQDGSRPGHGSRTTYDTGTLLMFVTEYHRPPRVKGEHEIPREPRAWIRDMVLFLINSQKSSGGFGYPKFREDLSNTQYALLGLRAARDSGSRVPGRAFKRVMDRVLAIQEQDGPKVLRTLGGENGERTYKIDAGDRARGWAYMTNPFLATGSMTTAGISSLAICHDALTRPRRLPTYTPRLSSTVHRSIQDGFAWLDANFTVGRNPPANAPAWHYYYLYGLERAAILAGRVLIGRHDWYVTGARYLVGHQKADGRWSTGVLGGKEHEKSDALDTAWAILFLKKATRPLDPIPAPIVTPSEQK